jgi:hypothetical protein
MNWETLLKAGSHWPNSEMDWVELLTGDVQGFIVTGKALVDKPDQRYLETFRTVLRRYDSTTVNNFIANLTDTFESKFPDLDDDEEDDKLELMEDNYLRIREAFEEHIGEYRGGGEKSAEGGKKGREHIDILMSRFSEAAKRLEAKQDVDWDELEAELTKVYKSDRDTQGLKEFRRSLSDKINRVIASNIPKDSNLPKLKSMYKNFAQTADSVNYTVETITPELAVVFLEKVQEPNKLEGESIGAVNQPGLISRFHETEMGEMQQQQRQRRKKKVTTKNIKISKLKKLQVRGSSRSRFTPVFKGLLEHDLDDAELGLTQRITSDLESRAINLDSIKGLVVDALWEIKMGKATTEEWEKKLGIPIPKMPIAAPFEKKDEEAFKEQVMRLITDDENAINQMTQGYRQKLSNYRQGVPKLFKDFIMQIAKNKNVYESKLNAIWSNGFDEFLDKIREQDSNSEPAGFRVIDSLLSRNKGMVPIYALPSNNKIKAMYKYMEEGEPFPENWSDSKEEAWDDLINDYFEFLGKPDNLEWSDVELFGDLLSIDSDNDDVKFSDPFRNAIAEFFTEVQSGNTELSVLTTKHTPSMARTVNITDLIKEIRFIENKLFGNAKVNAILQDDSTTGKALKGDLSDEEFKSLVEGFYKVFDAVITNIRKEVIKLIQEHLEMMVNNQAEYLQYNIQIFDILQIGGGIGKGLIRRE